MRGRRAWAWSRPKAAGRDFRPAPGFSRIFSRIFLRENSREIPGKFRGRPRKKTGGIPGEFPRNFPPAGGRIPPEGAGARDQGKKVGESLGCFGKMGYLRTILQVKPHGCEVLRGRREDTNTLISGMPEGGRNPPRDQEGKAEAFGKHWPSPPAGPPRSDARRRAAGRAETPARSGTARHLSNMTFIYEIARGRGGTLPGSKVKKRKKKEKR